MDPSGDDRLWVVDDRPSRRFPIYTRGNTGEVYPNVITPLCGSIVKDPIARGQAAVFTELGAVVARDLAEGDCAVLTGCFGGYLYANLSIGRLMGARAPGMGPEDVDLLLFGTSDAPPYRRQPGDRDARATARLARLLARALRGPAFDWLEQERREVRAWVHSRPATGASEDELLATVDEGAERLPGLMRSLLLASCFAGIGSSVAERLAGGADPAVRASAAAGVGGVDSAGPPVELWQLAQVVAGGPGLDALFDDGPGIAGRLEAAGDEAAGFRAAFADFLERYGGRGPDEYELASDTWGTRPDIALAAIERLRHAGDADPVRAQAELRARRQQAVEHVVAATPRPVRPLVRRALRTATLGAAGRELAKGTFIEALYGMRLALFELVRRAQDRGGPAEWRDGWLVTRHELPAFLADPRPFAEVVAERAEQRDVLQSRTPPFVFEGAIPDPASWPRRDGAPSPTAAPRRLEGIGVSPGVARGRVRVVRDPSDPAGLAPGDVLVAPITDPAWTPLFLVAEAVVVEVGAALSHAAIVARELGIPAVVSAPRATDLPPGTLVEVDGTHGTVTRVG